MFHCHKKTRNKDVYKFIRCKSMKKIHINGIVASGKISCAKNLSKKLDFTYSELDVIVWNKTKDGRYKCTNKRWGYKGTR